jgi:transcriptional regulator with XRE-family HTH domain
MTEKCKAKLDDVAFHGERVRALRHTRGISADRLGKLADLTVRHIYRLECNQRPNVWGTTVARLAVILETSSDYLLGLTDDPTPYSHQKEKTDDNAPLQ